MMVVLDDEMNYEIVSRPMSWKTLFHRIWARNLEVRSGPEIRLCRRCNSDAGLVYYMYVYIDVRL